MYSSQLQEGTKFIPLWPKAISFSIRFYKDYDIVVPFTSEILSGNKIVNFVKNPSLLLYSN